MAEPSDTFKKAPRRKGDRGRRVSVSSVSPEMRQAYADLITKRGEQEESYKRHLPQDPPKNR